MGLADDTVPMLATAECDQDVTPAATDTVATPLTPEDHAEITLLRGENFNCLACTLFLKKFFFLAKLAATQHELKLKSQEVAAGDSSTELIWVECPKKLGSLERAMLIQSDDNCSYRDFCVSPFSFLLSVLELKSYYSLMLLSLHQLRVFVLR